MAARIVHPINDRVTVRPPGNTLAFATAANDRGAAPADMPLQHMLLVLKHSDQQEMNLRLLLDRQREAGAPGYRQWLTPAQFGQRFGPAPSDVAQVTQWLQAEGFAIERVAQGGGVIEFSGSAGSLASAFHTELHRYHAAGLDAGLHWANDRDPAIPAALAPVVAGIASLNDLRARSSAHIVGHRPVRPDVNFQDGAHALGPGDFAVIYDTTPLLTAKVDGAGETIALVARSDINASDYFQFRNLFLSNHPGPGLKTIAADTDPGVTQTGDNVEATLDAEWASAVAPGAQVDLVVSDGSDTTDGVDLAALYIVDHDLAPVMSTSFGQCEAQLGAAENAFWNNLYEQAAAEGISAFVSAGDNGPAGCDDPTQTVAKGGLAVSGLAATPFNTAVGGTEFNEGVNVAQYWGTPRADLSSALSYIPEMVWNETAPSAGNPASLFAGAGGVSTLYPKPAWQAGAGVPADQHRDLPDLSLAAAGGHDGYVLCLSQEVQGQFVSCPNGVFLVGGTSASSPALAGITALIAQKMGSRLGLVNPVLYALAAKLPATFHDTTVGTNTVPGQVGFAAAPGYDLATGLGSVDAATLATNWSSIAFAASTTSLTLTPPANLVHGQSVPLSIQVTAGSGTPVPSGSVELLAQHTDGSQTAIQNFPLDSTGKIATTATSLLPGGSYSVLARYSGDLNYGSSVSAPVPVTAAPEASTTTLGVLDYISGKAVATTNVTYGDPVSIFAKVAGASGQGTPSGTVAFGEMLWPVNAEGTASEPFPAYLFGGNDPLQAAYGGDASFQPSAAAPVSLTVQLAPTVLTLTGNSASSGAQFTATVTTKAIAGMAPNGYLSFFAGGALLGQIPLATANPDPKTGTFISTATLDAAVVPGGSQATITAQYPGNVDYAASAPSNPLTITTPPNLSVSPAKLDFGTVAIGTASAPLTATITNLGGFASAPAKIQITGNTGVAAGNPFSESDSCGAGLAPGASCTVSITMRPVQSGDQSGSLFLGNANLRLVGFAPGFSTSTSTFIGSAPAGQNTQTTLSIAPIGGFSGQVTFSCSGLPVLSTCSFSPPTVSLDGTTTATTLVTISTTAAPAAGSVLPWADWGVGLGLGLLALLGVAGARGPRRVRSWTPAGLALLASVALACGGGPGGSGVNPPPVPPPATVPGASLSPLLLNFGTAVVGQTSPPQTLTLTSAGTASLGYSGMAFIQPTGDPKAFAASTTCSGSLAPQATCTFTVTFAPTLAASETGRMQIQDNATGSPQSIPLFGFGVNSTPKGQYPIQINATSGPVNATSSFFLVVQ